MSSNFFSSLLKSNVNGQGQKERMFQDVNDIHVKEAKESKGGLVGFLSGKPKPQTITIKVSSANAASTIWSPGKRKRGNENENENVNVAESKHESEGGAADNLYKGESSKLQTRRPFTGRELENKAATAAAPAAATAAEPKKAVVSSSSISSSQTRMIIDDKENSREKHEKEHGHHSKDVRFETSRQEAEKVDTSYSFVYPSAPSSSSSMFEFDDLPSDEEQITYLFRFTHHTHTIQLIKHKFHKFHKFQQISQISQYTLNNHPCV